MNVFFLFFFLEINAKDPELDRTVNIGFPIAKQAKAEDKGQKKERQWMKTRGSLESAARSRECKCDV